MARNRLSPSRNPGKLRSLLANIVRSFQEHSAICPSNYETEGFEQATDLVLNVPPHLHQKATGIQERADTMTVLTLDLNLSEPASLHNAGKAKRIVTVGFVGLHRQGGTGVARINTNGRQTPCFQFPPKPA